jgi:CRP/FNR family transcriptional regulator, cyclic AMP receptor protein
MIMEDLSRIASEHPFFTGLGEDFIHLVTGCARNVRFEAGQYLLREGEAANEFFLIRHGRVAIELATPNRGTMTILTVGPGDVVGVSWLVPPYRWNFDARALELVRALSIDAACLRGKCEADHDLGYDLMKRFMPMLIARLHSTRLQMLDVYGDHA